jgi:opacity protein-like surface antigen
VRRAFLALLPLVVCVVPSARAQSLFERLNLDRLQLTSLGATAGTIHPSRAHDTEGYGVYADYGYIARSWRVVFSATYWGSQFDDEVVETFEQRLREQTIDPSGDDTLELGDIDVSDIALEVDFRYTPRPNAAIRPYAGGGLGAHIINAESAFINDTFVESSLDNISAGFAAFAGFDTAPVSRISFGFQGRINLISNLRYWSLRGLVTYFFGNQPPSSPP